jgi:hypothetical protein
MTALLVSTGSRSALAAPEAAKDSKASRGAATEPTTPGPTADARPSSEVTAADAETGVEARLGDREGKRIWSIALGMETHVAIASHDDGSLTHTEKLVNFFFLSTQLFVSSYDQVRVDAGLFEHFLADPGESGLRLADTSLSYTHSLPILTEAGLSPSAIPTKGVLVRGGVSVTAPTSFSSRLLGIITVPRLRLSFERAFFDHSLFLSAGGFVEYYVDKYRSSPTGGTNAMSRYAVQAGADYCIPALKKLSAGVAVGSSWTYYYGVEGVSTTPYGTVADPQYSSQPVQQNYNFQANASYALPTVKEIGSSFALAYSMGDNALHGGVQHLYFGYYRRSTELSASLSARY